MPFILTKSQFEFIVLFLISEIPNDNVFIM